MKTYNLMIVSIGLFILSLFNNCSDVEFASADLSSYNGKGGEEVAKVCGQSPHSSRTFNFDFKKPTSTCAWGVNGNLHERDGYLQARIEQLKNFQMPANSVICDMEFDFVPQPMRYDDHFLMTFNDSIIASSYDYAPGQFVEKAGVPQFVWGAMAGIKWDKTRHVAHCLGEASGLSSCDFPGHDEQGTISLDYSSDIIHSLVALDLGRTNHQFKVVSIGDNDAMDCEVSDISFSLRVKYITR